MHLCGVSRVSAAGNTHLCFRLPKEQGMATDVTNEWELEVERLEGAIEASESSGIRGRWDSGRFLLSKKIGKQLPPYLRSFLRDKFKLDGSEVTARMRL